MYVLLLIVVTALKILLCKGLVLGIILLLVWIKGRQLRFDSDEWDNFFLSLPPEKIQQGAIGIYLAAAAVSSVISYFVLELAGSGHSLGIAAVLLWADWRFPLINGIQEERIICEKGIRRYQKQF